LYFSIIFFFHLSIKKSNLESLSEEKKLLQIQSQKLRQRQNDIKTAVYRGKTEKIVQELRELSYISPPVYKDVQRDALKKIIHDEMQKENPPEKIRNIKRVLAAFGYLKNDFDLYNAINKLYQEQIAGFYDPDKKTLFSIKDLPLSGNLQRAILAHELTHVLQDQHYDLKEHFDNKSKSDDEKIALQSIVEGDATFITQLFYIKTLNFSVIADLFSFFTLDQKQFNQTPMVIKENLLFPYLKGMEFVTYLHRKGGWEQINKAFEYPPKSSEQIIHPEKFIDNEMPVDIKLPSIDKEMKDWNTVEINVIGEFNIFILVKKFLNQPKAKIASEGWGGDKYMYLENKSRDGYILIWSTRWDTEKDAEQFEETYKKLLVKNILLLKKT
ncbi:MAG: hypothetical protein P9M03_07725, partial [Candidatus Theseobacter exili]|nr:hypothetical protein [Candidatus Theseobacter exili]